MVRPQGWRWALGSDAQRPTPKGHPTLFLAEFRVLIQDVLVAVAGLAGAHVEERRASRVDGVFRIPVLVAVVLANPAVDPLAGFRVNSQGGSPYRWAAGRF